MFTPPRLLLAMGALSLALILGVLGFQYIGRFPPCELCHWQRWPHIAAAVIGLGGGVLVRFGAIGPQAAKPLAWCVVFLIALSGALGVYHAGVEWRFWQGPQECTGSAFRFTGGKLDLSAPVVQCDIAAWRLLGLSLAGYNAIVSLAAAGIGSVLLMRSGKGR
jgi:disulfide bond formation protein DsbB